MVERLPKTLCRTKTGDTTGGMTGEISCGRTRYTISQNRTGCREKEMNRLSNTHYLENDHLL